MGCKRFAKAVWILGLIYVFCLDASNATCGYYSHWYAKAGGPIKTNFGNSCNTLPTSIAMCKCVLRCDKQVPAMFASNVGREILSRRYMFGCPILFSVFLPCLGYPGKGPFCVCTANVSSLSKNFHQVLSIGDGDDLPDILCLQEIRIHPMWLGAQIWPEWLYFATWPPIRSEENCCSHKNCDPQTSAGRCCLFVPGFLCYSSNPDP